MHQVCNFPGQHQEEQKHAKLLFYNTCNIFVFTSFVSSKLKISTLRYRSLIHTGIVDMDDYIINHDTTNTFTMVVPFAATAAWLW